MFSKLNGIIAVAAVLTPLAAMPAFAAPANLLSDGSFEQQPVSGSYATINAGSSFGAWHVDSGSIDLIHSYWQSEDGAQSVDLSGNGPGTISQSVNLLSGQQYQLSFWLAGNTDGSPTVKQLGVFADGNQLGTPTFDTTGHSLANMGWKEFTYNFTAANSGPISISFQSQQPGPYGPALDNISLHAVPEASTVLTFGLLCLGGFFVIRKRKTANVAG